MSSSAAALALILASLGAPSVDPATADAPVNAWLAALRKHPSILADFEQVKRHPAFDKPQVSRGQVYLQRPATLRFTYRSPHQVQLSVDGRTVRMHYPKSGRTQTLDLDANPKMGIVFDTLSFFIAADPTLLRARYDVRYQPDVSPVVHLTPKDPGMARMIRSIEVQADLAQGVLTTVVLTQTDESVTTFSFSNPKPGAPAPSP